jgi:hypothetical protein
MVRTVSRVLLAFVFAWLVLVPAGAAVAATTDTIVLAQPAPGPDIPAAPTVQDAAESRKKLVIGVSAAVLLGIVILGHRIRSKRKKDSGGS